MRPWQWPSGIAARQPSDRPEVRTAPLVDQRWPTRGAFASDITSKRQVEPSDQISL